MISKHVEIRLQSTTSPWFQKTQLHPFSHRFNSIGDFMSWCICQTYIQYCSEGNKKKIFNLSGSYTCINIQIYMYKYTNKLIGILFMIMITLQSKKSYKFWFPCMWNCFHLFGWSTLLCKIIVHCLVVVSDQWFFLSLSGFSFFKINVSWLATRTSESLRILQVKIIKNYIQLIWERFSEKCARDNPER